MSIVMTMGQSQFQDQLMSDEYARWSYDASKALFNYYEQLSDDMAEPIEFDRVAIRCDWSEYDSLGEAYSEYESGHLSYMNAMREYFEDRTTLIELDNGHVLVQVF